MCIRDRDERREALDYYESYFDEAGEAEEASLIQKLGSPGKVAAIIKADLKENSSSAGTYKMCIRDRIKAALLGAGYTEENWPLITGQDAEVMATKNIIDGTQTMSIYKDTRLLAEKAVTMVDAVLKGEEPEINDTEQYDNGKMADSYTHLVFAAGMGKQFNFQDINARLLIHPELGFGADAILPEKRLIAPTLHKQIIRRELKRERLGEELRVLYVCLLYTSNIPKNTESGGILTELDREFFADQGVELAPGPKELMNIQRFYLYLNLTKPSEHLCLSFANSNMKGEAVSPAYLIHTVRRLYPQPVSYTHLDVYKRQG